ncbi:MAG: 16S rRNA processing protein RimM [Mycoplasmataceae bacterium]|nr:16S rRNA processing protein RimM [Mycoplasmataceae bacterium]
MNKNQNKNQNNNQNQSNNLVWAGTLVNTHGIKGELRLLTNSTNIDDEFKIGTKIIVEDNEYTIAKMRKHKSFVLLTFENITNINEVISLKNKKLYLYKNETDVYLTDFIGYDVINQDNIKIGIVNSFLNQGSYESIEVMLKNKKITNIPFINEFIIKIIEKDKKLIVKIPEEFFN